MARPDMKRLEHGRQSRLALSARNAFRARGIASRRRRRGEWPRRRRRGSGRTPRYALGRVMNELAPFALRPASIVSWRGRDYGSKGVHAARLSTSRQRPHAKNLHRVSLCQLLGELGRSRGIGEQLRQYPGERLSPRARAGERLSPRRRAGERLSSRRRAGERLSSRQRAGDLLSSRRRGGKRLLPLRLSEEDRLRPLRLSEERLLPRRLSEEERLRPRRLPEDERRPLRNSGE